VCELGGLAEAVDRDAPMGGRALLQHAAQMLAELAVEVQRVVHELVREARLFGDPARRDQIADPVRLHVDALDAALAHEPLQIDVRQPERNPQLRRERALGDARVFLDGFEKLQIAMGFDIHVRPAHGVVSASTCRCFSIACSAATQSAGSSMAMPRSDGITYAAVRSPYKLGSESNSRCVRN